MTHGFDKDYWDQHWDQRRDQAHEPAVTVGDEGTVNPYLSREVADLEPGTALDAGCGTGAEAIWLAQRGWRVSAVDISATALAAAATLAAGLPVAHPVTWLQADLTAWAPAERFDLVITNYAHPAMPQLAFYDRIADWVAPRGTLLIVGHLHQPDASGHGHEHGHPDGHGDQHGSPPPAQATVTLAELSARLDPAVWQVHTIEEHLRTRTGPDGRAVSLRDVVVRATRRA